MPDTTPASPRPARAGQYVGLTAGSAFLLVAAVVVAGVLRSGFVAAHRTVGWVVACSVVALLIEPLVAALDRRLPRVLAVIVVLLGIAAVLSLVGFGMVREVTDSLDELRNQAPVAAERMEERSSWAADIGLADRVTAFVEELDGRMSGDAVSRAAAIVPTYLVTGILMLFLLGGGRKYIDGFLRQIPEDRRTTWRRVITSGGRDGRRWLHGALAFGLVVGVVFGALAWALGLPAAVSLGAIVGAMAILPLIGIVFGGLPLALLAFGLEGWPAGVTVVVALIAAQVVEVVVVRPWIEHRSVRVGPTVPIVVGLLGFELYGGGGAVYGVALAVIALAALAAIRPAPAGAT